MADYDVSNSYGTYGESEPSIYDVITQMESWNRGINFTLSNVEQTLTDTNEKQAQLEITVDGISTNVIAIDGRVSAAESSIEQNAYEITTRVSYTDYTGETIVSMINQTPDTVTIAAKNINFSGAIFGDDTATFAGNIYTDNSIHIGNSLYLGTQTDYVTSKAISFNDNSFITGSSYGANGYNMTVESQIISLIAGTTEFSVTEDGIGANTYGNIYITFQDPATASFHIQGGPLIVNDMVYTQNGFYVDGINIDSMYWRKGSSSGFLSSSVYVGNASIGVGGTFDSSTNPANVSLGLTNIYVPNKVYAGGVALTSDRERKKNIIEYTKDVWEDIKTLTPYQYNLDNELDSELPHLGILLQESPVDIVDPIGGVEGYAFTTFLLKCLKEVIARIELLEGAV